MNNVRTNGPQRPKDLIDASTIWRPGWDYLGTADPSIVCIYSGKNGDIKAIGQSLEYFDEILAHSTLWLATLTSRKR